MTSSKAKIGPLGRLNKRLRGTGDSEPEQAKVRLAIGFIVVGYIIIPWGPGETLVSTFTSLAGIMGTIYYTSALTIFAAIVIYPKALQIRRICGAVLDMGMLSWLMYYSGAETVPFFLIYLWVILGNGFRFGLTNLYISQAIAILGFSGVVIWGDYWQQHLIFGISLLLTICLLPLYAGFLIKKLHAAVESAKQANEAKSRFLEFAWAINY